MSYVFVETSHDWADEFDLVACFVAEEKQFHKNLEIIKKAFDDGIINEEDEFWFGTNEALTFSDYGHLMDGVSFDSCSDAFAQEFQTLTNGRVGMNVISRLIDRINEKENE